MIRDTLEANPFISSAVSYVYKRQLLNILILELHKLLNLSYLSS